MKYLIVGSGLYGATFAYEATKRGKKVLVIDKRNHIGGNVYCEKTEGINVHKYGAHIWFLFSINRHFFPLLFASYANIDPNKPEPTIK